MNKNILFQELELKCGVKFFKSSMSEGLGNKYLQPEKEICNLYKMWGYGGSGIVITGNVMVDENNLAEPCNIVFNENSDEDLLKKWAMCGKINDTKIMVQLNHPGKQTPKTICKQPVSPSGVPFSEDFGKMFNKPRELSNSEVKKLVQKFANSAKIVKEAGFSGIQIHAAHGYLISQFLSPFDNIRTDEYGGNLENRMRFLIEVYLAIRAKVGYKFPVGIKINCSDFCEGGFSEKESISVIKKLDELDIDFIEVSGGNYENAKMMTNTTSASENIFFANYAKKIKQLIKVPIIVTGGIRTAKSMSKVLEDGIADMVGLARPLAIIPNIPNQIKNNNYKKIETKRLSTGIKFLDKKIGGMLGLVYYQMLMQKHARGKKIKLTTNAFPALCHSIYHHGLVSILPQRAKKR